MENELLSARDAPPSYKRSGSRESTEQAPAMPFDRGLDVARRRGLVDDDSQITLDKDGNIMIVGKNIKIIGNETVVVSGDTIEVKGGKESKIGVGGQNSVYNTEKVATSGAGITSTAVGEHNISGAVVKIN
jgi:type VI secretion system secreted protein VgrG